MSLFPLNLCFHSTSPMEFYSNIIYIYAWLSFTDDPIMFYFNKNIYINWNLKWKIFTVTMKLKLFLKWVTTTIIINTPLSRKCYTVCLQSKHNFIRDTCQWDGCEVNFKFYLFSPFVLGLLFCFTMSSCISSWRVSSYCWNETGLASIKPLMLFL